MSGVRVQFPKRQNFHGPRMLSLISLRSSGSARGAHVGNSFCRFRLVDQQLHLGDKVAPPLLVDEVSGFRFLEVYVAVRTDDLALIDVTIALAAELQPRWDSPAAAGIDNREPAGEASQARQRQHGRALEQRR